MIEYHTQTVPVTVYSFNLHLTVANIVTHRMQKIFSFQTYIPSSSDYIVPEKSGTMSMT